MKYTPKTYITLFWGVIAISGSAIFARVANAASSVTAMYRLGITAVILLTVLAFRRENREELMRLRPRNIALCLASGALIAVHYAMWFESLNMTSVASSTVLVSLQPLFAIFFGAVFLREKVSRVGMIGCAIAIAGSVIIGWGDFAVSRTALIGDIVALASAAFISMYFMVGQVVRRDMSALTYSALSYSFSTVLLLGYALIRGDSLWGFDALTWGAFLGLALFSTICGQFVFNMLLKRLPASAVSMSILGEPIGTCILARILLDERILPRQLIGIAVIITGLVIYFFPPKFMQKSKRTVI